MSNLEGAMEKDWIEFEESGLRDELDQAGPFVTPNHLAEILARESSANSTPLYHFAAGVLAARTVLQLQGENHARG